MHTSARLYITVILSIWATFAIAADGDFQSNVIKAQANGRTEAGATYDAILGKMLQNNVNFESSMTGCLTKNPGTQSVRGYFHFISANKYQVVLEPQNDFSACLANALEGHNLPEPPSIPYFNSFSFSTVP